MEMPIVDLSGSSRIDALERELNTLQWERDEDESAIWGEIARLQTQLAQLTEIVTTLVEIDQSQSRQSRILTEIVEGLVRH